VSLNQESPIPIARRTISIHGAILTRKARRGTGETSINKFFHGRKVGPKVWVVGGALQEARLGKIKGRETIRAFPVRLRAQQKKIFAAAG